MTDSHRFQRPLSMPEAIAKARYWWNAQEVCHVLQDPEPASYSADRRAPQSLELVSPEIRVLGGIRPGLERIRIRDQAQARVLERGPQSLSNDFADSILLVNQRMAHQWGCLGFRQPVPVLDAIMAAPALVHGLTVATWDEVGF